MVTMNESLFIQTHPITIAASLNNPVQYLSILTNILESLNFAQNIFNAFQSFHDWYFSGSFSPQDSPILADIACHMLVPMIAFWAIGSFYTFVDLTHWPAAIYRLKQRPQKVKINAGRLLKTAALALFNQLAILTLNSLIVQLLFHVRGRDLSPQVPSPSRVALDLAVYILLQEPVAYYVHRLLHTNKTLYRAVHQVHHRWETPISLTALYNHPAEYLINQLPIFIGPVVMGSHRSVIALWMVLVQMMLLKVHSGYRFPGELWFSEFHDYHHHRPDKNYSNSGLFDYLYGTQGWFDNDAMKKGKNGKLAKLKK